ncbi:MAG TPA: ribokinase [Ruminiclostridium sp.]
MKILDFGSINKDYVYSVDHIVTPGETISSKSLDTFWGGKGLNQCVALAKAGSDVYMAGQAFFEDKDEITQLLAGYAIHSDYMGFCNAPTGHTIIQVDSKGQNCIVLFPGANNCNSKEFIEEVLSQFSKGDIILLQNEINHIEYIIDKAFDKGITIVFNPSPFDNSFFKFQLHKIGIFILNEVEGTAFTGKSDPNEILKSMLEIAPSAIIVLTLGKNGVLYMDKNHFYKHGIYNVPVIDTTGAGDAFSGFFLAAYSSGHDIDYCLKVASIASSLTVSVKGATTSIPYMKQVLEAQLVPCP